MSLLFKKLKAGLEEAIEHAKSPETSTARVKTRVLNITPVEIITPTEVRQVRMKLKLNQFQFADLVGVSLNTVSKWEQGSNIPSGSSLRMLQILKADPSIPSAVGLLSSEQSN